jgi:hypothetical protein
MQGVTLTIAVILSVLTLTLKPRHALVVYLSGLLWYPSYLAISIGTIDIMVGRVVGGVLLLRCLSNDRIRSRFTWSRLDTWVACSMLVYIGIPLLTQSTFAIIENRGGFVMDTWLAYMVARFIITDRTELVSVIKCISIILIPLALLGCMEAVTGWQPFVPLRRFRPWNPITGEVAGAMRWGFTRAVGPFSHPILFGGCFAMFLPLIYYLRHEKNRWQRLAYPLSAITILGALSSMSSGPWIMVMVIIFCLVMEKHQRWTKPMIVFFIFSCIFIQIFSNRDFYQVIFSYGSMLGGAGWHRARLIEVAIRNIGEWWLAGYGGKDPGWGHYFGMGHTDITNEYILAGVRYGIAGIIVLCIVLFVAFNSLITAFKKNTHPAMKSLYWTLGTVLFSVATTWMSVSFFGQLMPLFYCFLGIIGSMSICEGIHQTTKSVMVQRIST